MVQTSEEQKSGAHGWARMGLGRTGGRGRWVGRAGGGAAKIDARRPAGQTHAHTHCHQKHPRLRLRPDQYRPREGRHTTASEEAESGGRGGSLLSPASKFPVGVGPKLITNNICCFATAVQRSRRCTGWAFMSDRRDDRRFCKYLLEKHDPELTASNHL